MKWALRIGLLVTLAAGTALAGGYFYLRQSLPRIDGTVTVAGLRQPAEVVRDRNDIPHIYGHSIEDTSFALGFVHAQDRLWQMEINRRISAGRLAEVFGPAALDADKFLRSLGLHRYAEATLAHFDPATRTSLAAYAAGVNAYLASRSGPLPPEFLIFGLKPEPWTPADSVAWIKVMAWELSGNFRFEMMRLQLARQGLSPQQIGEFLPPYPGDAPVALADLGGLYRHLGFDVAGLAKLLPEPLPPGAGSNNWVVAGSRSATGKPLLANDPHLGYSAPSVWYLADLEAPNFQVAGATLPGVPLVVLGHNARIAWGFTNTGSDVEDLYIEKIDPTDPSRYITPDGSRPFTLRQETIKVKGQPDVALTVRSTRHGPVISDVLQTAGKAVAAGEVLAFQWTALTDEDLTVEAGSRMQQAGNWAEFLAAVKEFAAPQQNMVYADIDGNIGFVAPGRVPIRKPENDLHGMVPAPGWDARYDWAGYIPFEALPQTFNPASGKVVSANNKIVPSSYPYFLTNDWAEPYRAQRIDDLLAARPVHSPQSFAAMQGDVLSAVARDFVPLLERTAPADDAAARAIALLKNWDGSMAAERPEPLIFVAWMREVSRLVLQDKFGALFPQLWDIHPQFLQDVLMDKNGESRWCGTGLTAAHGDCPALVSHALDRALADLRQRYGEDMTAWRWGTAHYARAAHRPFSGKPVVGRLFDITVPTPGGTYSIDVGRYNIADAAGPFTAHHGPALRAIYDLADLDRSQFMISTGQSGNPLSPRYSDFAKPWAAVDYITIPTRRADVEPGKLGTLRLRPAAE